MISDVVNAITFNPLVERSNRSRPTILLKGFKRLSPFFSSIEKVRVHTGYTVGTLNLIK